MPLLPELPEVEAVVRKVRRAAKGARITGVQVFRSRATHPQPPALLEQAIGHSIRTVDRRGKNIIVRLDGGVALRVHLRMTGNLRVIPEARLYPISVRVLLALKGGRALVLDDPRLLGSVHFHTTEELDSILARVGIDPLTAGFTPEFLVQAARRSERPVKEFLMNQHPIAGLGNIYAAEALFRARIHPARPVHSIRRSRLVALHAAIQDVLRSAIRSAIRAYEHPGRHDRTDYFVYGRMNELCRLCSRQIERLQQSGRSTYYCPRCQR